MAAADLTSDVRRARIDRNFVPKQLAGHIQGDDGRRRPGRNNVPGQPLAGFVKNQVRRIGQCGATAYTLALIGRFNREGWRFLCLVTATIGWRFNGYASQSTAITPTQLAPQRAADQNQDQAQVEENSHGDHGVRVKGLPI